MNESALKPIISALEDAARRDFWGQIQTDFQHGKAVLLRIAETIKLPAKENNHDDRSRHDHSSHSR